MEGEVGLQYSRQSRRHCLARISKVSPSKQVCLFLSKQGRGLEWLRVLIALSEDPASIPSTHMAADNCLLLQVQGISHFFLAFIVTVHMHTAKHSYTFLKIFKKKKEEPYVIANTSNLST